MPGTPFDLTPGEKLILLMLSELYEHLGVKSKEIDPKIVSAAIYAGHPWALKDKYSGIPLTDTQEEVADEVATIISMWQYVTASYDQLSPEDQQVVRDGVQFWTVHSNFHGFDGNNETEHYSVARFLTRELDSFQEFKGIDLNSHTEMLPRYRKMMVLYDKYLHDSVSRGRSGLRPKELIEIFNSQGD